MFALAVLLAADTCKQKQTQTEPDPVIRKGMAGYWMAKTDTSGQVTVNMGSDSSIQLILGSKWQVADSSSNVNRVWDSLTLPRRAGNFILMGGDSYRIDSLRKWLSRKDFKRLMSKVK